MKLHRVWRFTDLTFGVSGPTEFNSHAAWQSYRRRVWIRLFVLATSFAICCSLASEVPLINLFSIVLLFAAGMHVIIIRDLNLERATEIEELLQESPPRCVAAEAFRALVTRQGGFATHRQFMKAVVAINAEVDP